MNLCYYQPVYNEDSDDVENEIIKLSIMHEQIDEENPVPPVIDSNDTSLEDTKCTKCEFNGITEEELRKHIVDLHSIVQEFKCMTTEDDLQHHVAQMHNLSCAYCWKVFIDKDELSKHSQNCQNDRKEKGWMDASLLLDVCKN